MKPKDGNSTNFSSPTMSGLDFPTKLEPLPELTFPKFPTVEELLQHEAGTSRHPLLQLTDVPPPPERSLFQDLLGGRLEILTQDALDNPDRYEEGTRSLLTELMNGAKKREQLSPAEQRLLNRATIDFATYQPEKPKAGVAPPKQKTTPKLLSLDVVMPETPKAEPVDPDMPAPAYWWLR